MKPVSPKEEFECSLGVDPSVRVTYKPAKKFRQHHGILTNKTQVKVEQHIEIKNTRLDTCKIKVSDQLPLSTDDKIKVWDCAQMDVDRLADDRHRQIVVYSSIIRAYL